MGDQVRGGSSGGKSRFLGIKAQTSGFANCSYDVDREVVLPIAVTMLTEKLRLTGAFTAIAEVPLEPSTASSGGWVL